MLKFLIFIGAFVLVHSGSSPHGESYLKSLSPEQLSKIPREVMEDALLDAVGLITKYGFPVEVHEVKTDDEYILTMHRIPEGKTNKGGVRPPVFLQHGVLMSSDDWIINGPEKALAYLLAEAGFDVWMGNARGNTYSRKHATLNPDKNSKFWKFSWHEIALHDLPAMIDYVLAQTGRQKLHYVGHSQGTTTFFVMGSEKRAYNNKIASMHALSPVAYMGHLKSPLVRLMAPFASSLELITSLIGINEFLPSSEFMALAANALCGEGSILVPVCTNVLFLLAGYNPDQLNTTMLPVYMAHTPAGASSRQLVHYGQEHMSKKFRQFDHGLNNFINYGSLTPPKYEPKHITAPVFLHYSDNDWLADGGDVDQLFNELGYAIGKFRVPMAEWNHLDYTWGIDAKTLIYDRVINLIWAFEL
ncbi:lipase 3-like [Arctopsyche grandis]|uniref:lipase 3-like n=1 Tax=Arctopsyche grandis TaxID=121162 RepID=UPI00406D7793